VCGVQDDVMQEESGVGAVLAEKFAELRPHLDERQWRLYLGGEARALARAEGLAVTGAAAVVAGAAGVSATTVVAGARELAEGAVPVPGRARKPGAGRKKAGVRDPGLAAALRDLLEASTRGDPVSPLRWTTLSLRGIVRALTGRGFRVGRSAVARMLHEDGWSLRGNSRTEEGKQHQDRDAQFRYISGQVREFLAAGDPVISVDTKKKEPAGNIAQDGKTWRPAGDPVRVRDHDFPDPALGKVAPYGIYDVAANAGFVSVGISHDTPVFAVESVRRWWQAAGAGRYPHARRLLITADAGGSNSYRARQWKRELAALAAGTGLEITVLHFPPGTSKWNKIEHRLFCHITRNWRGRPLTSYEVIIESIAAVTTTTGLTVTAVMDLNTYPTGQTVSDSDMRELEERCLDRHPWHGDWNYSILPVPRPAPEPAPQPGPPGPDPAIAAALAALAGIDLPALAAAVAVPWQAAREQHLYLARGRARTTRRPGAAAQLSLDALIAATTCHHRLGMTWALLGQVLGLHPSTISVPAARLTPLLEAHAITPPPGSGRVTTLTQLHQHAAARGITIPGHPDTPGNPN
jgi:hypothetical protein